MKRVNISVIIVCVALVFTTKAYASNPDIEKLRKRFTADLLAPPVQEQRVRELMSTLRTDGTWPGIDYVDTARIAFQHTRHLSNLVLMARAYKKPGSPLAGNKQLKKAIDSALNFWLAHDFICENWWNNQIGTPNDLTAVLLMMDTSLSKKQIAETLAITARANINAWGARQSGDRIKIAGIQAKNALFKRDVATFEMLMKVIEGEIRFVPFEQRGLMHDYSFHHRDDKVNNTLSYGAGYAEAFAEWADKVADTRYHFSQKAIHLLIDYYLDGMCKQMAFGGWSDISITNRDLSRPRSFGMASIVMPERLMRISDYRHDELQELVDIRLNKIHPSRSFDVFFWQSEHYVHQRPTYYTSVRMFSSRNANMEVPYNGEGLLNHYRGDGTNYITVDGKEYYSITPVYDWQKIPGTTTMQRPAMPPESEIQKYGVMDFVGAATNGHYGAVGFDFISPHDPLRARKAWFFFDNEYVCLGAGIKGDSQLPVVTTLDQCKLDGEVTVGVDGGRQVLPDGSRNINNPQWVFHKDIGYLFPAPAKVVVANQAQSGSWFNINRQTTTPKDVLSMDVFKLYVNHGNHPGNGSYAYIVMPAATLQSVADAYANPAVEILSNTPALQAVWHKRLNMLQAVCYKNGHITCPGGLSLTVYSPCIVMVKTANGQPQELTVADPTRNMGRITLQLNGKEHEIELPQGEFAGKSVVIPLD